MFTHKKSKLVFAAATLSSLIVLPSCGNKVTSAVEEITQENQSTSTGEVKKLAVNVNKYASSKVVCNPFDGGATTQTNYEKGIKAELYYARTGAPRLYNSLDYVLFAQKSEQNIFLTDMNVPTRMFTEGFSGLNGTVMQNDSGQKLIEFFGLKMMSNLILTENDSDGDYELALLSDDGTTFKIKSGDGDIADEVLINNDGDHPTRMGCSTRTVRMRKNVMLPIEVTYYQGPRYHISNVLVWRKATEAGKDSLCNQLGNNLFWNPDNNSSEQQAVKDLKARGWKVVAPDNFVIGTKTDYNPCVAGTNPVISNLQLGEVILTSVSMSWNTDIPATAQLELTNMTTGQVTTTTSDNVLRTSHNVQLNGLQAATTYQARVIAVSEDLGRTISSPLTFQTQ